MLNVHNVLLDEDLSEQDRLDVSSLSSSSGQCARRRVAITSATPRLRYLKIIQSLRKRIELAKCFGGHSPSSDNMKIQIHLIYSIVCLCGQRQTTCPPETTTTRSYSHENSCAESTHQNNDTFCCLYPSIPPDHISQKLLAVFYACMPAKRKHWTTACQFSGNNIMMSVTCFHASEWPGLLHWLSVFYGTRANRIVQQYDQVLCGMLLRGRELG